MQKDKIIFIDDDKEILKNYVEMFSSAQEKNTFSVLDDLFDEIKEEKKDKRERKEYDVHTASQGLEGVALVKAALERREPFKVAFIDMRMPPGIDGKETSQLLRELDPDLEIVIVTAYSDHSLEDLAYDIGAPDRLLYLKKPFDPVEIKQFALSLTTKWNESRVKDEFLANISHELKTPLASIIGFSSLLEEAETLSSEHQQFISIIKSSGEMMKYYVDDLITLVSMGQTDYELDVIAIDLGEIIEEVVALFRPSIKSKENFKLSVHMADPETKVSADRKRLKQCLVNIVSNAIKYTIEGEVCITIERDDKALTLSVKDTGIGISEENMQLIFNRFERIEKDHHAIPGLGLGLAICKKIIDLHSNIDLKIESELGKGTNFKLIFGEDL